MHPGVRVLPLTGELCIAELPRVRCRIDELIADGARELVLDLTETTLVTAAAVRVIETTERRLTGMGGALWLRNPLPIARRVLEITGFDRLIESVAA